MTESFWTEDADGNLLLHGGRNLTYDMDVAYVPPIMMVDSPLFLGKTWTTYGILMYDLDGTPWGLDPIDCTARVYTEGTMEVPAGEFYASGVGEDVNPCQRFTTPRGVFDIFCRRLGESDAGYDNSSEWYADGVGHVQYGHRTDPDYRFRLVSYELPPVPAARKTWGSIKALFAPVSGGQP